MNTVTVGNESLMTMLTRPDWSHAITITKRNCDTIGDMYLHMSEGISRLLSDMDRDAKFVLVVCQHPPYMGESSPHGHGVLRTRLSHREINKCFSGGFAALNDMYDPYGWAEYIAPQAIPECHLTNIEE
jgi:hypothetical protein